MQSNVLILTNWSFNDALIQTYTLPYLRIIRSLQPSGSSMLLLTLESRVLSAAERESIKESLKREGIEWIHGRYFRLGFRAVTSWPGLLLRLWYSSIRSSIGTIHCWGTPAGAGGYLLSVITGAKLVIDSYEPHAEAMVENGSWTRKSFAFRALFAMERLQTARASVLIAANEDMREYALVKYGKELKDMLTKPACVDMQIFDPAIKDNGALAAQLGLTGKLVAVYAGKFGGIYLDREVFDFFKAASDRWGEKFRVLLLTGHTGSEIDAYCKSSGLDRSLIVARFVPHAQMPRFLALADFAVTPVKPVPTKRYCTPIKDGEYWAMGLPVVITAGISNDSAIIRQEGIGAVLTNLNTASYVAALEEVDALLAEPGSDLANRIRSVALRYRSFSIAELVYRKVYGS